MAQQTPSLPPLPIVGIGASAGGVEALQRFFEALPEQLGVAFVVIIHLDPEHRSELAPILARKTALPVEEVSGTVPLEANHVYVIPPDRRLQITNAEISALPFDQPRGQRAPIDLFFRSLAEQYGDGFAVILSGSGSDGAVGVKAIKEQDGLILVQDPQEAAFNGMPRAAMATGVADLVLPVRELAQRLVEIIRGKHRIQARLEAAVQLDDVDEATLRRILAHLHAKTGHDFSKYKRPTLLRRLARRMQVHRQETLGDYLAFLRHNAEEAQALFDELLISVTTFFRDPDAWEALAEQVIARLLEHREPDAPLRAWVPGCATGEEAYSLAILFLEEADRRGVWPEIQLFASDLDAGALATGREGRYPSAIAADVSEARLHRFFIREDDHYRITEAVRGRVVFAPHNLLRDPPFSRLDLISCRNLLIYLDRELQEQVFGIFRYALHPGGYLFLGDSESAEGKEFRTLDKKHHLFQARDIRSKVPCLPELLLTTPRVHAPTEHPRPRPRLAPASAPKVHRQFLEALAPPSLLVDAQRQVLHVSETAGRFLQPPGGALTGEVTALVRPALQMELSAALHHAFEHNEAHLSAFVPVTFNGTSRRVAILVQPRPGTEDQERLALVMFLEGGEVMEDSAVEEPASSTQLRRLKKELQQTQARLHTSREASEAVNEELRAANEELQSLNEEYRSTGEELETSKEELQSLNEELQTVNTELKNKLDEVSCAKSDLENLMAATEIGTLFLDRRLCIRRFTPPVVDLFPVKSGDLGRPVADFTHRLDYARLETDARQVLRDLVPLEREAKSQDGSWYLVRLRPYRTADDRIEGVIVTFVDITAHKQTEAALRQERAQLETILQQLPVGIILAEAPSGKLLFGNDQTRHILRHDFIAAETIDGYAAYQGFHPDGRPYAPHDWPLARALTTGESVAQEEIRYQCGDGSFGWLMANAAPIHNAEGQIVAGVVTFEDISARKQIEETLHDSQEQLQTALAIGQIGLWSWTVGNTYSLLDGTCQRLLGLPPGTERLDQTTWVTLVHPDDRERLTTALQRTLQEATPIDMEYRIVRPADGQVRWLVAKGNRLDNPPEGAAVMLGALLDITEHKQIEASLQQAQKMEGIGQLTGGIAHDFNNLLTIILGNLQLLEAPLKHQPRLDKNVQTARQAARRGAELIRQLLAYARRQALEPQAIDLNQRLTDTLTLLQRTLGEVIEIRMVPGQALWPARADPHQLETALINLALNARDAMPEGGALTIETTNVSLDGTYANRERDLQPGDYVRLAVSDTGSGMSPEVLERAFEPFFTTKETGQGSGLGLSMVYGFAKQSKGHIKLYSESGRGATVTLYLPRAEQDMIQASAPPLAGPSLTGGPETVLVVEDDEEVLELAANFLASLGYRVLKATHGSAALALLEQEPDIDLLFTDVVMPGGMSGVELAREARHRRPNLKVLYTSGYTEHTLVHQGQLKAGTVLLNKPYQLETLAAKVRSALNGTSQGSEPEQV